MIYTSLNFNQVNVRMTPIIKSAVFNRTKLIHQLSSIKVGLIYLKGASAQLRQWTDVDVPFRQESYFYYLTGINEPDCHLTIDLSTKKSCLFIPKHESDHALWCGESMTLDQTIEAYQVDSCLYSDRLNGAFALNKECVYSLNDIDIQTTLKIDRFVLRK